jgi:DNA-binding beta-propeller fold protein YncE
MCRRRRLRHYVLRSVETAFATTAVLLVILVMPATGSSIALSSWTARSALVPESLSGTPHDIASCDSDQPLADGYDPADGYVYASPGFYWVNIVGSPCHVVKSIFINSPAFMSAFAYDPLTREEVLVGSSVVWIFQSVSLVKTVRLGAGQSGSYAAWDPALDAMLIANYLGGVDLLYISDAAGVTKTAFIPNAFDEGNRPGAILDSGGYIFSAGKRVDVFNDRTLEFLGSFPLSSPKQGWETMAWDPLNGTAVLTIEVCCGDHQPDHGVYFLEANSVATRTFTYHRLSGFLPGGPGGVIYSTARQALYITATSGGVWILGPTGATQKLGPDEVGAPSGLAYNSENRDVYVCTFLSLVVIS